MPPSPARINVRALYAALDAQREARGMSWRQLAKDRGLSPSTFTRLANGHRPDVDAFAVLVGWLLQPAERFITSGQPRPEEEPPLLAELAPLLRARSDLDEDDAVRLQALFAQALTQFQADRAHG